MASIAIMHTKKEQQKQKNVLRQGSAYDASLALLLGEDQYSQTEIDDYRITTSFEAAEGMYMLQPNGMIAWTPPESADNQHFEVIVQDRTDHRFLPYLDVLLNLFTERKSPVISTHIPYIWHPFVFHYGMNGIIPGKGTFIPEVSIAPPAFHRHDQFRGKRYLQPITVTLPHVHLTPGQKPFGPE